MNWTVHRRKYISVYSTLWKIYFYGRDYKRVCKLHFPDYLKSRYFFFFSLFFFTRLSRYKISRLHGSLNDINLWLLDIVLSFLVRFYKLYQTLSLTLLSFNFDCNSKKKTNVFQISFIELHFGIPQTSHRKAIKTRM